MIHILGLPYYLDVRRYLSYRWKCFWQNQTLPFRPQKTLHGYGTRSKPWSNIWWSNCSCPKTLRNLNPPERCGAIKSRGKGYMQNSYHPRWALERYFLPLSLRTLALGMVNGHGTLHGGCSALLIDLCVHFSRWHPRLSNHNDMTGQVAPPWPR